MRLFLAALVLLSGCTVNVVDKRLTREEVATALKQRDEALVILSQKIMELDAAIPKPKENK